MHPTVPVRIMIVGEDSHFCHLMRSYIRRSACQSMFSAPGGDVFEIIQRELPAAIVLDADLPAMGGWNLLRSLKTNVTTCEIPVVICSWKEEMERGRKEGANVYLRMPVLYADFIEALNTVGLKLDHRYHNL